MDTCTASWRKRTNRRAGGGWLPYCARVRARIAATAACAVLAASIAGALDQRPEQSDDAAAKRPTPSAAPGARLVKVGSFESPTYLASPPGDRNRRFVTEREGTVRVLRGTSRVRRPFLDISRMVSSDGEGGLLSIAFAPDYARSRRYFVYYTDGAGDLRVDSYLASARFPNRTQSGSRRPVIRVDHDRSNHKGGQVQFGADGKLYVGFGDGGGGGDPDENAQNLSKSLLGKMVRIAPRAGGGYSVPRDNPFVGRAGRDEIFAYGLRNPYRFSFDRATGDLTIGDVGQEEVEEIDFVPVAKGKRRPRGGVNFGWDVFEGKRAYENGSAPGHLPPVLQRTRSTGSCSIIGGYVIRDPSLGRLRGAYVYGDLCVSGLRVARLRAGGAEGDRALGPRVASLVSFGEDGRGRVHAISLEGSVFRLAPR